MQTKIAKKFLDTQPGIEANRILRNCVHCGFCIATCPTYQLLGDELDSPRGRIYLIKQVLEGQNVTSKTQSHLDRCLTCRSCETTCPSGVEYVHLIDIGRKLVEQQVKRPLVKRIQRFLLRKILAHPKRLLLVSKVMKYINPILPEYMRMPMDNSPGLTFSPGKKHARSVILLEGCVQSTISPNINTATKLILDAVGISVTSVQGIDCCGAISHHLNAHEEAVNTIKNNIDRWWPLLEGGCEAIVSNATGCGITIKEYPTYMQEQPDYVDKAKEISARVKDISEIITEHDVGELKLPRPEKVSFHVPCTMQHGLKLKNKTEKLLTSLGFELSPVRDAHLCCGSAGTYSILQPAISEQLKQNKLTCLSEAKPDYIITANIGCLHHLQSGTETPVRHWTELVALHL